MTPLAAAARHGEVIQERFAGTGSRQRALHGRVIHPAGKGIAFFLQLLKVGFHLRDTAGDFFGAAAEVHPAQLIQLRLQVIYFAFTLVQLFPAEGQFSASCSARRRFSSSISSGSKLFILGILPGSFSVDQDKEAYNIVSDGAVF
jgi:hypothetical protein